MPRVSNLIGGKYRLLEQIGEGSMGSVWKAMHETLERPFAVKFLKDHDFDSTRLEDRFLSEARVAAAVRHRAIVDVVDFGRTDEGTPYMVMELLEGASLAWRLVQPDPPPVLELLSIIQQALAGLEAVHRAGILHRDLKPENIVLVCEDGEIVAKVIDFGVSRPLNQDQSRTSGTLPGMRLTIPGTTVGTPWYMAPEQAQALPTMDHRADLYAVGVILYEACAGQLPFEHDDLHMLLLLVAAGGAQPLSTHRPDLPAALSDAIARAMNPDPDLRFSSAAEFAASLRQVADEIPADVLCRRRRDAFSSIARQAAARPTPHSFLSDAPPQTGPLERADGAATERAEPPADASTLSAAPTRLGQPAARGVLSAPILVPRAVWAKVRRTRLGRRSLWVASGAVVAAASLVLLLAVAGDDDPPARRLPQALGTGIPGPALARVPLVQKNAVTSTSPLPTEAVPTTVAGPSVKGSVAGPPIKRRSLRRPREVFRTPGF